MKKPLHVWRDALVRLACWFLILAGGFFSAQSHAVSFWYAPAFGGKAACAPSTNRLAVLQCLYDNDSPAVGLKGPYSIAQCHTITPWSGGPANILAGPPYGPGDCGAQGHTTLSGVQVDCAGADIISSSNLVCHAPPPSCAAATVASGWFDMGTSPVDPPSAVCASGCFAIFSGSSVSKRARVAGIYHYYAEGQYDIPPGGAANSCTSGESLPTGSPGGVPATSCGPGQAAGQVNGIDVCVGTTTQAPVDPVATPGATTTTTTQTPATPPTGPADTSGDGTKVVVNPNGSTTTTTTTTNPTTGVKTITETNKPPAAPGAPTDGKPDPVKSFCVENPAAPICKEEDEDESSFGGSCAGFSCDGDAVQCAMAKEQYKRNCTLFETATPLSDLGTAAIAGTDSGTTDNPAAIGKRETKSIGTSLDESRFISGNCPAPISTSIAGQSISVSFTNACNALGVVGQIAVVVSLLVAVRVVGVF